MPFDMEPFEVPANDLSIDQARQAIMEFLDWLPAFFEEVGRAARDDEEFRAFFVEGFLDLYAQALMEFKDDQALPNAIDFIRTNDAYLLTIREHGLSGAQLALKTSIMHHWFTGFLIGGRKKLMARFLSALNAFLKSILSSVPGGGAIVELKDAIESSLAEDD